MYGDVFNCHITIFKRTVYLYSISNLFIFCSKMSRQMKDEKSLKL
jgi:hypothetical protein